MFHLAAVFDSSRLIAPPFTALISMLIESQIGSAHCRWRSQSKLELGLKTYLVQTAFSILNWRSQKIHFQTSNAGPSSCQPIMWTIKTYLIQYFGFFLLLSEFFHIRWLGCNQPPTPPPRPLLLTLSERKLFGPNIFQSNCKRHQKSYHDVSARHVDIVVLNVLC